MSKKNYKLSEEGTVLLYRLIVKTMYKNEDYPYYSENERDEAYRKALSEKNLLLTHRYTQDSEKTPDEI